jgi:hypothetical protein
MIRVIFEIAGEPNEAAFESLDDAVIGGHARLGVDPGAIVRVGEVTEAGVAWLGQWTYETCAIWRPRKGAIDAAQAVRRHRSVGHAPARRTARR